MKKIFLTLSIATSMLLAKQNIKFEIEPTIGYNAFDRKSSIKNNYLYGVRVGLYSTNHLGFRLGYETSANLKDNNSSVNGKNKFQRISGDFILYKDNEYKFTPYLLAGYGYESFEKNNDDIQNQSYAELGIGYRYALLQHFIYHLEAKEIYKFNSSETDFVLNMGLGLLFGGDNRDITKSKLDNLIAMNKKNIPQKQFTPAPIKKSVPEVAKEKPVKIDTQPSYQNTQQITPSISHINPQPEQTIVVSQSSIEVLP